MASTSITTFGANFKKSYSSKVMDDKSLKDRPLLAVLPKEDGFYGESIYEYINEGNPQSRSGTFANTQTNLDNSKGTKFERTRIQDYGTVRIDRESWMASQNDVGAFFDLKKKEMDGILASLMDSAHFNLFRNGSGKRATVGSESNYDIVLSSQADIRFFERGMTLKFYNGGSARTGTAKISSINPDTYTLTTATTHWHDQITSLTAGDYIYIDGDVSEMIQGLDVHLPASLTTFCGVDQTVDPLNRAGLRVTGTGMLYTDAIRKALFTANLLKCNGQNLIVANPMVIEQIHAEILNKSYITVPAIGSNGKELDWGFDTVNFVSPYTNGLPLLSDPNCQTDVIWILKKEAWKVKHLGGFPHVSVPFADNPVYNADEFEMRASYFANLWCNHYRPQIRLTVTAPPINW